MNDKIKPKMSFEELFGKDGSIFSEEQRRERWEQWRASSRTKAHKWVIEYWSGNDQCGDCIHCERSNGYSWCKLQGLPNSVNPYLSFKYGMLGMACMGMGKESQ